MPQNNRLATSDCLGPMGRLHALFPASTKRSAHRRPFGVGPGRSESHTRGDRTAQRGKKLPCHFIPLNLEGETIYSLLRIGDVEKLEQLLLEWLDTTIEQEQKSSCTGKSAQTEKGPA